MFHDAIDFSTRQDAHVEKSVFEAVREKYPDHGFFGEEHESLRSTDAPFTWYLDPIDGTKYYGRGVPLFTISLGLKHEGTPVLGVVYDPIADHMFSATVGEGAWRNDTRLAVEDKQSLNECIIGIELGDEDKEWEQRTLQTLITKAGRVRLFGNATLSICWSTMNALSGYVDLFGMADHGKEQDLVASLVIAQEAGMAVRHIARAGDKTKLVCAVPGIVEELTSLVAS